MVLSANFGKPSRSTYIVHHNFTILSSHSFPTEIAYAPPAPGPCWTPARTRRSFARSSAGSPWLWWIVGRPKLCPKNMSFFGGLNHGKHGEKWDKTMRHADFWGLKWIQLEHDSTMKTSDTQTIRNICFNDTQAMNDGFGCGLANVCQFHGSVNRGNDLTWYNI